MVCRASAIWASVEASCESLSCKDARMVRWISSSSFKSSMAGSPVNEAAAILSIGYGCLRSHQAVALVLLGCRWAVRSDRLAASAGRCTAAIALWFAAESMAVAHSSVPSITTESKSE